ncbi:MAG: conjugal transfer protein [Syntrophomonadaceae bacterium]|jgi:hypothetical protein
MGRELTQVRNKKKKLLEKKALIDEQLGLLSIREEELENLEVIAVFRKANITLEELMEKFNETKNKEKTHEENSFEK